MLVENLRTTSHPTCILITIMPSSLLNRKLKPTMVALDHLKRMQIAKEEVHSVLKMRIRSSRERTVSNMEMLVKVKLLKSM